MATAKFSDFTAVLGSNLASGDLLLVSRVGGSTSAKLSMSELRSYLDGFYSVLAHTHAAAAISGLGSAATVSASTFAAASHTHSTGDITGLGSAATVSASTFATASHTHAFSDIGVGTTSGVGFGMSAGSSTSGGAVLNIQAGSVGKAIESFDDTNTSRFSVSVTGIVTGRTYQSTAAHGTQPLGISSTTACTNLNADFLDGSHASAFATSSHTHGMSSLTGDTFTAGQLMGGTGAGGLLSKVNAGTAGQCLGWTTGGVFTAITPGTGSGGATSATILYDAPSLWAMGTNAATIEQVTGSTSTGYVASYDDTVEEYRYGAFIVPSQINGSGTVSFSTISRTKNNTTGNMIWTYGQSSQASGASWDAAYTDHDSAATAVASNNSNTLTICTWSVAVSTLGWTADDLVQFRLSRDPGDTVVGDICLHALKITVPLA